jgi:hypothetical protein
VRSGLNASMAWGKSSTDSYVSLSTRLRPLSFVGRTGDTGRRLPRTALLAAFLAITLAAGQGTTDASSTSNSPTHPASYALSPNLAAGSQILEVREGARPGEVTIRFAAGVSALAARATGHNYGLELIGGPMISGPLPASTYIFAPPRIPIQAVTPTTAEVYFPSFLSRADSMSFIASSHLRLLRWLKPLEELEIALVALPPIDLHAQLIDPARGLFRVRLGGSVGARPGPPVDQL